MKVQRFGGRSESGQIILIMATALCFVILVSAALAIDFGNGLVQKRRLQNVADAAVLAAAQIVASGGTESDAVAQAQSLVSSNTGGSVTLPYPGFGSGTNLTSGIEVAGGDVRVALQKNVPTFFTGMFGLNSLTVAAKSRSIVGPYGALPIAISRFSDGDTSIPLGQSGNPGSVHDYLRPANSDSISAWPASLIAAPPAASYTPPSSYNPNVSGRVFPILGQDAQSNVSNGNDFHGLVALDVRNVTSTTPTYYNGVTSGTSIQNLKSMESSYILARGYPGPNPAVGEQLGVLNGVNTSNTVSAARKVYQRGDIITGIVYNGTVYRKPAFGLSLDSPEKTSGDIGPSGSPLSFQLTLGPSNGFISSGVELSATGLEDWASWRFGSGGADTPYTVEVPGNPVSVTFRVSADSAVSGVKTALIRAYDPDTGNTQTISATVVVGSTPGFSVAVPEGFKILEQGSSVRFDLDLQGWNSYPDSNVSISGPSWYNVGTPPAGVSAPAGITASWSSPVQVRNGHVTNLRVTVTGTDSAAVGNWLLKLDFSDGTTSRNQSVYLNLQNILSSTGSAGNTTSFVNVLGYANFVITYANNASTFNSNPDSNSLYAYCVSPLVASPNSLSRGLSARLMSWGQTR